MLSGNVCRAVKGLWNSEGVASALQFIDLLDITRAFSRLSLIHHRGERPPISHKRQPQSFRC